MTKQSKFAYQAFMIGLTFAGLVLWYIFAILSAPSFYTISFWRLSNLISGIVIAGALVILGMIYYQVSKYKGE